MRSARRMPTDPHPVRSPAEQPNRSASRGSLSAQCLVDRRTELLGGERLEEAGGELDAKLVAEAGEHPLEQSPDVIVGLANQYLCHVAMIDQSREIPGAQTV